MSADGAKPRVSVIIPMRNAVDTIQDCLRALDRQTQGPHEVIVIDNDSTDDSLALVQGMANEIKNFNLLTSFEKLRGPAAARNTGIEQSEGEILAFTDSDCIPEPDWIQKIVDHFLQDTSLDVLGGVEKRLPHASSVVGKLMTFAWLPRGLETYMVSKEGFYSGQVVATFNCAARRTTVMEAGGFDTGFQLAGEDADLWFRAFDQGARIAVWVSDVIVEHRQDITLRALLRKMFRYGEAEAHIVRHHFSGRIALKGLLGGYYSIPTPLGTLMVYSIINVLFLLLSVFGLLLAGVIPLSLFLGIGLFGFLLLVFSSRRRLMTTGYKVPMTEVALCSLYHIGKRMAEEAGRLYGSVKYGVICI